LPKEWDGKKMKEKKETYVIVEELGIHAKERHGARPGLGFNSAWDRSHDVPARLSLRDPADRR
jgi:hypothetical protein